MSAWCLAGSKADISEFLTWLWHLLAIVIKLCLTGRMSHVEGVLGNTLKGLTMWDPTCATKTRSHAGSLL